jgi:hypothetical protein
MRRTIRRVAAGAIALLVSSQLAVGQGFSPSGPSQSTPRETIIGGEQPPPPQRCIEVEIAGDRAFGCLNQQLKREVDRVNPLPNQPPLDAKSRDIQVGNVNVPAVRQQYGPNFERSVIPFRPPAPALPHR